ncbi:hypothetical protein SAMN05428964_102490 [Thalassospira xiamenensis]|uniref:Uncharacterized protein n=1 Tax=Thalassospira xiamenensis TaxID=220697 RepID=A0A285T8T7_9PROT|nr:hypothetical protein SAMN05428964_102490 [Thalassospira xiamenensis]
MIVGQICVVGVISSNFIFTIVLYKKLLVIKNGLKVSKKRDLFITNLHLNVLWSFKTIDHKSLYPFYSYSVIGGRDVWFVVLPIGYKSSRG